MNVGKHQDVEEFGVCSGTERAESRTESVLEFVGTPGSEAYAQSE